MATRGAGGRLPEHLAEAIAVLKAAAFDLVVVETPGIGQGDADIVPFVDRALYVMTPEFGAASQLEKIDMLDFADAVAINKFERRGADDALRDVGRQLVRNREAFGAAWQDMPVFGTSAATFDDDGVTALYHHLRDLLAADGLPVGEGRLARLAGKTSTRRDAVLPPNRVRYLAEIAETVRGYRDETQAWAELARRRQHLRTAREVVGEAVAPALDEAERALPAAAAALLEEWPRTVEEYSGDELVVTVRDRELRTPLTRETLSGNRVRRVALPRLADHGDLLRFLRAENLPGRFPFTAGVFPFKREGEDPARMFAGEGDAFRTNRRFHLLSEHSPAKRLSTAFDSVTLYGRDPDTRPDVYGKVGTSGVSIATLEDMKALYAGFDLCSPTTSVSMTINGPAPTILAYFLNTAIDQQVAAFVEREGREPSDEERSELTAFALANVRGTVQADILKEDQGQNTCIFSTEFSLRMMADIQEWFIPHQVRNFYSVSISGYHIAEAGANPISQLAFTLANGFTYVEAYLARGMAIDDFAPNLSFFFSNGMDAEYTVIGRVARRIWAVAMRETLRGERAVAEAQVPRADLGPVAARAGDGLQRHPHHAAGVVRALRQRELAAHQRLRRGGHHADGGVGPACDGDPADHRQGVGAVGEREPAAGGVRRRRAHRPGRGGRARRVRPHRRARRRAGRDGDRLPARADPGRVDALRAPQARRVAADRRGEHLRPRDRRRAGRRSSWRGRRSRRSSRQLDRLDDFHARHATDAAAALRRLQDVATGGGNVFDELMRAARVCSLGQLTGAFFEVGGQYRRNV